MVKALGEPLVVIRRSALNDVLAGALASGTVHTGVMVKEIELTSDGVRITLSDSTTRHAAAVIGADGTHSMVARHLNGPLRNRYAGYTAWRGIADSALDPDLAGETLGAGFECGHVPLGSDHTYWFATERAPEGRLAPEGELAYLQTKFASWAEPLPALLAATDPDVVLRNDLYDRDRGASLVEGPHRPGRRRRPPDAPTPGPGRLSGARGRRDPGRLRRPDRRRGDGVRPVRDVPQARVRALVRESATDRKDRQPAAGLPQRRGHPRDGPGARGGVDPAPGDGGVAVGVHRARDGVSLGRTG